MKDYKYELASQLIYFDNGWGEILIDSLASLDYSYLKFMHQNNDYFPDKNTFLNAFKYHTPHSVKYILFGQDPYPRKESAIGEAFIDGAVKSLWSKDGGLSKQVNKATSLRNIIKMLLYAHGYLSDDFSPAAIKKINKQHLIKTIFDLRDNFVANGVLLLNTALIFTSSSDSSYHIKKWQPFIRTLLKLLNRKPTLILLGNFAQKYIGNLPEAKNYPKVEFEHPFNTSFITSPQVVSFFKPMELVFE
jgi:uracil-DNA glycosylase